MTTYLKQSYRLWKRRQARKVRSRDTRAGIATQETRWTPVNRALAEYVGKGGAHG